MKSSILFLTAALEVHYCKGCEWINPQVQIFSFLWLRESVLEYYAKTFPLGALDGLLFYGFTDGFLSLFR